jgi:hypothetical protein
MTTETFTDTNGTSWSTHDANWTSINGNAIGQIQSNNARPNSTYNYCAAYYNGSTQQYSQVTLAPQTSVQPGNRGVRINAGSANEGYNFYHNTSSGANFTGANLEKNGSYSASSSAYTQAYGSAHTITVRRTGSTIYGDVAGVNVLSYSDGTPLTGGYDGFYTWAQATNDADLDVQDWTNGASTGGTIIPVNMSGGMQQLNGGLNG